MLLRLGKPGLGQVLQGLEGKAVGLGKVEARSWEGRGRVLEGSRAILGRRSWKS